MQRYQPYLVTSDDGVDFTIVICHLPISSRRHADPTIAFVALSFNNNVTESDNEEREKEAMRRYIKKEGVNRKSYY